jgi:hypothetical protein
MKTKTLLIAAVMFLGISVAAFAQATFTVSASPVPLVVSTGYAEKIGSIGFSTVPESDVTVTGYIYIKVGSLPIANKASQALQDLIQIDKFVDADANLPGHTVPPMIEVAGIEQSTDIPPVDVLVLSVYPADPATAARLYSFRVSGVRVDVTEWLATAPLTATIFSTENLLTNGEVTTTVLYGSKKPISAFATENAVVLSALNGGSGYVDLDATEGFRNAFGKITANDPTQNVVQSLKIKLPNVPPGISITFPNFDASGNWQVCNFTGCSAAVTGNGTTKYVIYYLIADTDVAAIEDVVFEDVLVQAASPALTLWDTSLAVIPEITLAPVFGDMVNFAAYVPRYLADWVPATTLFTWEEEFDNTFLMMPYATTQVGFDTGIAVANTSASGDADELDWPMLPNLLQGGELVFRFFDKTQGMFELRTSDAAVLATLKQDVLDAEGKLPSGKSYVVLLSQLLEAAEFEGEFSGYVLINARFPFAHGQYFVSDFGDFTNGSLMLVVETRNGRRSFRGEDLGQ